jgi:hypothetical protein
MLNPMETSVLTTPDGAWQFAIKEPRPPLGRWVSKLWELDGTAPPARERELPRGDISLIVNLEGRHAVVDATDPGREHVFKDAWGAGLQERAFLTASGGRAWLCGARLTVEGAYRLFGVAPRELANTCAREFRAIAGTTITDYRRGRQFGADYGFARESQSHSSKS